MVRPISTIYRLSKKRDTDRCLEPEERSIYDDFEEINPPYSLVAHRENGYIPASYLRPIKMSGWMKMPDIYENGLGVIVSNRFKIALERLVLGQIEFLPLDLYVPPHMEPDSSYYLLNIVNRQSYLDWIRMKTRIRPNKWSDGREVRLATVKGIFKAQADDEPRIWLEVSVEAPDTVFYVGRYIGQYMSEPLWDALNKEFPHQLHPMDY